MRREVKGWERVSVAAVLIVAALSAHAQASDPAALEVVHAAVNAELQANRTDKSIWMYKERDTTPDKDALYDSIETTQGTLRRLIELNGKPLSGEATQRESQRILNYIHDSAAQARAHRAGEHDGAQATEMLKMLPVAFLWTVASETPEFVTLKFRPNPKFDPPDMQSRVMGTMGGEMIIAKDGNRIRTLRGALTDDVLIGFGILGKINRGGTFDVERRELAPGIWQIHETHVHIGGHALIFKTIGQQEDDVKTEWQRSTAQTLDQAAHLLHAE
jgi:hypothetical protein